MKQRSFLLGVLFLFLVSLQAYAGEISGKLLTPRGDPQSHIQYSCNIYGSNSSIGVGTFSSSTNPEGIFYNPYLTAGTYTLGFSEKDHFDVVYRKGIQVPANGNTWEVIQYDPASFSVGTEYFDDYNTWYAQSFRATGDNLISVGVRTQHAGDGAIQVTIHDGDNPYAPQIGPTRLAGVSATNGRCAYWSAGEVPTIPGHIYTARFSHPNGGGFRPWYHTVDTRMTSSNPDGRTWVEGTEIEHPLEMSVNMDDHGLINTMCCASFDPDVTVTVPLGGFVGQTFTAKGTDMVMVTWLCGGDGLASKMVAVSVHDGVAPDGTVGPQISPTKYVKAEWWDVRSVVTFAPGEVPTTPGHKYFVKLKFLSTSTYKPQVYHTASYADYAGGDGYISTGPDSVYKLDRDLGLGVYEEKFSGSVDQPEVNIDNFRVESISAHSAVVKWTPSRYSTALVEYGKSTPYTNSVFAGLSLAPAVTLTDLEPNTMYHVRAIGTATGCRDGVSKDMVFVTAPESVNLVRDPGFESGSFGMWTKFGLGEIAPVGWFWGSGARTGSWGLGGATNGGTAKGGAYQQVPAVPGARYDLSAWAFTFCQGANFYTRGYQTTFRVGIDPTGGTDPDAASVQWSHWANSHEVWTQVATSAVAAGNYITVFLHGGNDGPLQWSVFSFDDVILTTDAQPAELGVSEALADTPDNTFVRLPGVVCTATAAQVGNYYVESPDRSSGIRVKTDDVMRAGDQVTLVGTLMTRATGERYLDNARVEWSATAVPVEPLHMRMSAIGGGALGQHCAAVPGTLGPYNVGLLAKCTGEVKLVDGALVYVNDGSLPGDGIKVRIGGSAMPQVGDFVSVTGVVQLQGTVGAATTRLYTRDDADLVIY